jgi:FKBP-type peptidyl-prolyl cis-trans isomerase FklB
MKKTLVRTVNLLLMAGLGLLNSAWAQPAPQAGVQATPPANPQQAATPKQQGSPAPGSPQAPAAKSQGTAAAKKRTAAGAKSTGVLTLKTPKDKVSYAIGMNVGTGLHKQSVDVDPAILLRGLKDGLAAGKTLLTEEEMRAALTELQGELRKKQQEAARLAGESNKKEGEAFLAANKGNEGVVTLPSGLQYKVLTEGTGPKPALTDSVVCNYRGTLINGTEFDSSYKRGQPTTFPVNGVIKAWTEALQLMPVGSKWQLFVPPDLAYGERGGEPVIGPNATLIFEVELLSIQAKDQK